MFCPDCRTEYQPGILVCADCSTPLIEALPPERVPIDVDVVTVLASSEIVQLATAKSLLEEAGIPYETMGEMDPLASGGLGGGVNTITGPIEIRVFAPDAQRAMTVLQELDIDHTAEMESLADE